MGSVHGQERVSLAYIFGAVVGGSEAAVSYVYIRSEPGLWTVGFYWPDGKWEPESDHGDSEEAAKRVAWLNGGRSERGA